MKKYLFYLVWNVLIFSSLSCFPVKIESTLSEKQIIVPGNSSYKIMAFDYSRKKDRVYCIELNLYIPSWKSTLDNPRNILSSFDLKTNRRTEIFKDFVTSPEKGAWLQLAKDGTLLVYDHGVYDPGIHKTTRFPRILIFKDNALYGEIPVISGREFDKETGGAGTKFKDYKDKRKYACEKLLEKSSIFKPIGYNKANSIRFDPNNNKKCPKFLVISVDYVEMAMDVDDCSEETFLKYADKYSDNRALFNNAAIGPVSDEKYLISKKENLYVQLYDKGFGYYNFSCEKYFKVLYWKNEALELKSCIHGFIEFPSSMNVITENNELIYRRFNGVYVTHK